MSNFSSFKWSSLFGDNLHIKGSDGNKTDVSTDFHLNNKTVLVYFSAHWCPPCRGFTPDLVSFYSMMQSKGLNQFEIVFASSDRDEHAFDEYYSEMPWAAMSYSNRSAKQTLSAKYGVSGIPMLVVLDTDGNVITKDGRNHVSNDPDGERFPWIPLSMEDELGSNFIGKGDAPVEKSSFAGKYIGIYFSAHWCPPCRNFTPKLVQFYNKRKELGHNDFEIIFASSDRDKKQFDEYFSSMPWLALPYSDKRISSLSTRFEVDGIPSFIILDTELKVVTKSAQNSVISDPLGVKFPFYPEPLESLSNGVESYGFDINTKPALLVLMENSDDAEQNDVKNILLPFANRLAKDKKDTLDGPEIIFFYAFEPSEIASQVRSLCDLPSVEKSGNDPIMILLNLADNGGYYRSDTAEINSETVGAFLEFFKAGSLERKQCRMSR